MTEVTTSVTSKILAILDAFSPERPELTLSELAARTGLTLPTLHRRAAELVEWGALERTQSSHYRIGLRLGRSARSRHAESDFANAPCRSSRTSTS